MSYADTLRPVTAIAVTEYTSSRANVVHVAGCSYTEDGWPTMPAVFGGVDLLDALHALAERQLAAGEPVTVDFCQRCET